MNKGSYIYNIINYGTRTIAYMNETLKNAPPDVFAA